MIDFLVSNSIFGDVTWGEFFYMASMLLFMFILSMVLENIDRKRKRIILILFFSIQLVSGMIIFGKKFAVFELLPFAVILLGIFVIYFVTNKKK